MRNIPMTSAVTPQNIIIMMQNVPGTSGFTPQNVSSIGGITGQNIALTGQNIANVDGDLAQVTPILPPGIISTPFPAQHNVVVISDIPEGFKKTKYEDTLEKTDLKTVSGQKAPKRIFCASVWIRGLKPVTQREII